jgi:DNA polymerase-3 subunit alpha (Gram-positive type)
LQNESLRSHQFGEYQLVYCKTAKGIKDIYRLVSISCTTNFYNSPRVIAKDLYGKRENLIIVNSPNDGDIWDAAINGTLNDLKTTILKYDYIFVSPPSTFEHEINRGSITKPNVNKIIKKIINTACELNKKVIAVSNSYYLDK